MFLFLLSSSYFKTVERSEWLVVACKTDSRLLSETSWINRFGRKKPKKPEKSVLDRKNSGDLNSTSLEKYRSDLGGERKLPSNGNLCAIRSSPPSKLLNAAMTMAINTPPEDVHRSDTDLQQHQQLHNNNKRPLSSTLDMVDVPPAASELSAVPEMNRTDHPWQWDQHQKAICHPPGGTMLLGGPAGGPPATVATPTYTDLNVKVRKIIHSLLLRF